MKFPFVSRSMYEELKKQYETRIAEKDALIESLDTERRQVWNRLHKQLFGLPMWETSAVAPIEHQDEPIETENKQEQADTLKELLLKANGRASRVGRAITAMNMRNVARSASEIGKNQVKGMLEEAAKIGKAVVTSEPQTGT